jgi:hypothetical protein
MLVNGHELRECRDRADREESEALAAFIRRTAAADTLETVARITWRTPTNPGDSHAQVHPPV